MGNAIRLLLASSLVAVLGACAPTAGEASAVNVRQSAGFMKVEWLPPAAQAAVPGAAKVCMARRLDAPPAMDGALGDPCWKDAQEISALTVLDTKGELADVQTHAKFAFTKDTLYAAFTCDEPNMAGLITKCTTSDSPGIWYDDCVEFWLDVNCDRLRAYHFLVNPAGVVCDMREWDEVVDDALAIQAGSRKVIHGEDVSWNSGCVAKTAKGKNGWTVEVAIPVRALGIDEIIRGSQWGLNVARTRRSGGGCWLTTWTGVFVTPISRFGTLQLGESDCDITVASLGNLSDGVNHLNLSVENLTGAARKIALDVHAVSARNTEERVQVAVAGGETKALQAPYALQGVGRKYTLTVDAKDAGTGERLFSRKYEGTVPEMLNVKLVNPELYIGEQKEIEARLSVRLGDADLPKASLSAELLSGKGEVISSDAVDRIQPSGVAKLNIAGLKAEGTYTLKFSLMDAGGKPVAQKQATFNLVQAPF